MALRRVLREFNLPSDDEEVTVDVSTKANRPKGLENVSSRKYGKLKVDRNKRLKKTANESQTWKKFGENKGYEKLKKKVKLAPLQVVEPSTDLINLGKVILRSRRQLIERTPARKPPKEQKSLFSEKDFKDFALEAKKIFCS